LTHRNDAAPSFMTRRSRRLRIFEPRATFPQRDARGEHTATFDTHKNLPGSRLRTHHARDNRAAWCRDDAGAHADTAPAHIRGIVNGCNHRVPWARPNACGALSIASAFDARWACFVMEPRASM